MLYGRCDEDAVASYQPFVEALSQYLDHASVEALIAELPGRGARARAADPAARRPPRRGHRGLAADAGDDRYRLFEAVLRRAAPARGHPAGAPPPRRPPLGRQADALAPAPRPALARAGRRLMLLGTFRKVDAGDELAGLFADLRREYRFDQLALTGFDAQEGAWSALLAADAARRRRRAPALREAACVRTAQPPGATRSSSNRCCGASAAARPRRR